MSVNDPGLVEKIAKSGANLSPRDGWQDSVRRQVRSAPSPQRARRSRLLPGVILATGLASVVAVFVMFEQGADREEQLKRDKVAMVEEIKRLSEEMEQAQVEIDMAQMKINQAFEDLEAAMTEEAKEAAQLQRRRAQTELAEKRAALQSLIERGRAKASRKAKAKKKRYKASIDRCAKSNDPLCGL